METHSYRVSFHYRLIRRHARVTDREVAAISAALVRRVEALVAAGEAGGGLERLRVGALDVLYEVIPARRLLKVLSVKPYLPN